MSSSEIDFSKVKKRKLEPTDNLSNFSCDLEDDLGCDEFIHEENEAKLFQKERHGVTYLFFYNEMIIGYVTLAMSSIPAKRIDKRYKKQIRLGFYPSLLIGRLAVGNNWRKKRVGKYLCDWCVGVAVELSEEIGCRYVILETSEGKVKFYSKCRFQKGIVLEGEDRKLVWMYQRIALE